ncbi:hypothetical protein [Nocardioides ganghwensis]|jgi:hypothetical protein|uniref:Glycosyl hydrolase family 98 putative carbohydrate-binding module domain-containing protein n=1 Tax=Nocardioides ganghwensis TaxID=252230 RepID=A0A4Q2S8R0_9ACTN|nr:hypothetical protein [Nocardioides ganghwensis]MBD3947428.1 hypothetical protein [Nocardioides ganghwensis]RYB99922.1 hypothetical protein EUA07_15665 [Nocardioides ganghwensis]
MNRIARVACAAATAVVFASLTPIAPASPAPDVGARQSAAPAYKVVASINRTEVVAGEDTVRITGKVKPKAAGQKVLLQQRPEASKRWRKSGTATIKSSGRFVLKDEPSKAGVRYYRVVKPASDGMKSGTSRELRLEVWGWTPLTWWPAGANSGVSLDYGTTFGTEPYYNSVLLRTAGTPGYVEYTLGRKVRALRATYALTDDSATGASGSVTVLVDGVRVVTHALTTGTITKDHVVDLTDAFRVRFDMSATATPAGRVAVGNPEVLYLP